MQKKIIFGIVSLLFADIASGDLKVSLSGNYDFQTAAKKQKPQYKTPVIGSNQNRLFLGSYARTALLVENRRNSFSSYGANIMLVTRTVDDNKLQAYINRSFLFAQSYLGRVELGSNFSASTLMSYGAHSVASGSGGASNGDWYNYVYDEAVSNENNDNDYGYYKQYINLLYELRKSDEGPLKISYFTPKIFKSLQLGFSYAPDGSNAPGTSKVINTPMQYLKNIFSAAATYSRKIGKLEMDLSLAYDNAKAVGNNIGFDKLDNLQSFVLGSKLALNRFSFAGSYSKNNNNFVEPLTFNAGFNPTLTHKSYFYTLGVGYKWSKFRSSLTYSSKKWAISSVINSNNYIVGVRTKAVSLGLDYLVISGLKTYIEFTQFTLGNSFVEQHPINPLPVNRGNVLIAGIKTQF
jgi:hypothetical protein